jgi:hypothetical protein
MLQFVADALINKRTKQPQEASAVGAAYEGVHELDSSDIPLLFVASGCTNFVTRQAKLVGAGFSRSRAAIAAVASC